MIIPYQTQKETPKDIKNNKKMKTQTNNLKKTATTAIAALFIATGSYTQPNDGDLGSTERVSLTALETLMNLTEASARYIAPAVPESEAFYAEFERLDMLAAGTEDLVKYEAPEINDADATSEMERMEVLVAATEASMRYEAPVIQDVTPELERMEWLAAVTEASLKYQAPEANEIIEGENSNENADMFASNSK
jgi:hypothetical protein